MRHGSPGTEGSHCDGDGPRAQSLEKEDSVWYEFQPGDVIPVQFGFLGSVEGGTRASRQAAVLFRDPEEEEEEERQFAPNASDIQGCLLLEDRGYEHKQFFADVQKAGGSYIIRGKINIRPTIHRAYNAQGHRLRHLEGKRLEWKVLPQETVDLDLEWGRGEKPYTGRLIAIYKRGKRNRKTYTSSCSSKSGSRTQTSTSSTQARVRLPKDSFG